MAAESLSESWLEDVSRLLESIHAPDAPDGTAQFAVSGSPSGALSFHAVVAAGRLTVSPGRRRDPDVVLGWAYSDLQAGLRDDLPLEVAYMSGTLKLEGDQALFFDGWRSLWRTPEFREALAAIS